MNTQIASYLKDIKRIVVKVGTRVIDHEKTHFNLPVIESLVAEIAELKASGVEVILVSSGAVGAGLRALKVAGRPSSVPLRQAYAAIGQGRLMKAYSDLFANHGVIAAQVLLTRSDLDRRESYNNARETLHHLLTIGAAPIINENDTVSVEELTFGDNDMLAALVAGAMEAQLLILLTTVDGLYRSFDPETRTGDLIETIDDFDAAFQWVHHKQDSMSMGGMKSKLQAANTAASKGVLAAISNGLQPGVLRGVLTGDARATWILPNRKKLAAWKYYLRYAKKPCGGSIVVDAGAVQAVIDGGKSLLASGVREIKGSFGEKDLVCVVDPLGVEIARGLVNYASAELSQVAGRSSGEIKKMPGGHQSGVVIHRDNLVLVK
ncbi:MAG: glutamate 5-kinase [bacterium]|nr:glutamate 5-kinase [bacterium]